MKKVILMLFVFFISLSGVSQSNYSVERTLDRHPTIENNIYFYVDSLGIEETQRLLVNLFNENTFIWSSSNINYKASFDEMDILLLKGMDKYGRVSREGSEYSLSKSIKFQGIGSRSNDIYALNLYMHRSIRKGKKWKYEKLVIGVEGYDNAQKIYILLQHYLNLLHQNSTK